ncbi:MAG TPA: DNA repair protein RecN [Thermohalobaculum sp.]|nr:DNA repair protein RecN [Thermohalobaculum sp.]
MLVSLEIRNIVLIEALTLEFRPGLNVLTGETGAGKSILLDALGFALGRKTGRELVGSAGGAGSATAVFAPGPGHPVRAVLDELGLPGADDLVLRRVAGQDGPARCFVNDQRTSAEALARIGETLVEVHGQHDDRGLLNPRLHRPLLDAFAGIAPLLAETRAAWGEAEDAARRLAESRAGLERARADEDYLRHCLAELEALAPEPGEAERLDAERRLMQSAAKIRDEVARAAEALSPAGAEGVLVQALSWLTHAAERAADPANGLLDAPIDAIDRAMLELTEAQRGVDAALERLRFEPGRLEAAEERLFAIRALARKHQAEPDALAGLAGEFARRLEAIDLGGARIAALETQAAKARRRYDACAGELSKARAEAAARLDTLVTAELAPLRMENARFRTVIGAGKPGPEGADEVGFSAAINPGAPPGPIERIASGGELARFLLALKVCLAARSPGLTMIFDEIDRGVGGATADAVGRRLARLAEGGQVLVVTHSPQVAARGAHHWRIVKSSDGKRTRTRVAALDAALRVDEIARMLAGEVVTPQARSAAKALMQGH